MIPINIILIVYAVYVFTSVQAQTVDEKEAVMDMYMGQLDSEIEQISTQIYRMSSEYDMLLLMQSDAQHSQSDIEWYAARTRVMDTYLQWIQDNPMIDGLFSYYDYKGEGENSFAIRSSTPNSVKDINTQMISLLENDLKEASEKGSTFLGCNWKIYKIQGEAYILRIWKNENSYAGCWINLDSVLSRWNTQSDGSADFVFLDGSGEICAGDSVSEGWTEKNVEYLSVGSENAALFLAERYDNGAVVNSMPKMVIFLIIIAVLALFAIPLLIIVTRKYILKPVNQLVAAMDVVSSGDLTFQIPENGVIGEFAILNENFNRMVRDLRKTKIAAYESEVQRQRIQMRYLSQQIQPHFVLNTLNILHSYEPEDYPLIQKMILCLSKYFRYIVKVHSDYVELYQELDHIKNYFVIQEARYPHQFDYYVEAEEGLENYMIPPLLIQNFTENAIKYSISMERKISIYVLVQFYEKDKMRIRIADTGKGLPQKVLDAIERFRRTHEYQEELGIGIQNAIERLDILYQGIPKIEFYNSVSGGATIDIIMPCHTREEMEDGKNEDSYDR